jgi:hypothetical protein
MAAIRPCTGTTAQWASVADILVLKEREIGVEIATRTDGTEYVVVRQGDGEKEFSQCRVLFDQSAYEDALSETKTSMATVQTFEQNMRDSAASANLAASSANAAATTANAAAKACEDALDGMNTMVDTVTGKSVVLGVEDGLLVLREA